MTTGVHSVRLSADGSAIEATVSADNEVVPLTPPLALSEYAERWMAALADSLAAALRELLAERLARGGPDMGKDPAQVGIYPTWPTCHVSPLGGTYSSGIPLLPLDNLMRRAIPPTCSVCHWLGMQACRWRYASSRSQL